MCKECGRQICPSACPHFAHELAGKGSAEAFCSLCGEAIYGDEVYYRRGRIVVCQQCERGMSLDELGLICGTREVLLLCGFERIS